MPKVNNVNNDSLNNDYYSNHEWKEGSMITHRGFNEGMESELIQNRIDKDKAEELERQIKALNVRAQKTTLPYLKALHKKIEEILQNNNLVDRDTLASIYNDYKKVSDESLDLYSSLNRILKDSDTPEDQAKYKFISNEFTLVKQEDIQAEML